MVGHITLKAIEGGPLAIIENGDRITIDAECSKIIPHLDERKIGARLAAWSPPLRYRSGGQVKFARSVRSASEWAVTDRSE